MLPGSRYSRVILIIVAIVVVVGLVMTALATPAVY
jgi:putative copper export protein